MKHYLYTTDRDAAHEIYHEDAVLEFPQSGERFEGVENFKQWRVNYPAKVEFELDRLRGRDDLWIAEVRGRYEIVLVKMLSGGGWQTRSTSGCRIWRGAPSAATPTWSLRCCSPGRFG
ncbi:MAG: nuclear transport factor 2 family protein [Pseudonocardiaceae bacterium]